MFVAIHTACALLLGNFTGFAIDEYGYAEVLKYLYDPNQSTSNFSVWVNSNLIFLRLLYLPAKILIILGFDVILSLRFLSILFSTISLVLILRSCRNLNYFYIKPKNLVVFIFLFPSIFLWTFLGLRESFIILFITLLFYGINKFTQRKKISSAVYICLGAIGLSQTKLYLFTLILISLFLTAVVMLVINKKMSFTELAVLGIVLIPIIIFPSLGKNIVNTGQGVLTSIEDQQPDQQQGQQPDQQPDQQQGQQSEGMTSYQFDYFLRNSEGSVFIKIIKIVGLDSYLKSNNLSKQVDIRLVISRPDMSDPGAIFISGAKFLFLPVPLMNNGSIFLNLISFEMFLWLILYVIFLIFMFRASKVIKKMEFVILWPFIFLISFLIFSSLFEINLGTIIRHRSILAIAILISIINLHSKKANPR
jgi:hypothetical protein